jgi:hypothetical protein
MRKGKCADAVLVPSEGACSWVLEEEGGGGDSDVGYTRSGQQLFCTRQCGASCQYPDSGSSGCAGVVVAVGTVVQRSKPEGAMSGFSRLTGEESTHFGDVDLEPTTTTKLENDLNMSP